MAGKRAKFDVVQEPPDADFDREAKDKSGQLSKLEDDEIRETTTAVGVDAALVAMPLETIPNTVPLPCTLYLKLNSKTLLFRRQGDRLSNKRAAELQAKGTSSLYIHKAFWQLFMDSLEKMQLPEPVTPEARALHLRHLLMAYGQELEKRIREPKKPYFEKLRKITDSLSLIIFHNPVVGAKLLRREKDPLLYFTNHSVNVAVFSSLIGAKLKFSLEDLKALAYAALVHDIGQLFVPKRILHKSSTLTEDETEMMRTHPRKGAELLESFTTPGKIVQAVFQHHERWDGDGYPSGLRGERINQFARIIAIADMYDALTSNRPFKEAVTPEQALQEMLASKGKLDPNILAVVNNEKVMPSK